MAKLSLSPDIIWVDIDGDNQSIGLRTEGIDENAAVSVQYHIDELFRFLPTTELFWGQQVPICPLHLGTHALAAYFSDDALSLVCPLTNHVIRELAL